MVNLNTPRKAKQFRKFQSEEYMREFTIRNATALRSSSLQRTNRPRIVYMMMQEAFEQMNIAKVQIGCTVYKILIRANEIRFVLIGYQRLGGITHNNNNRHLNITIGATGYHS
jgi:hypothetical protein